MNSNQILLIIPVIFIIFLAFQEIANRRKFLNRLRDALPGNPENLLHVLLNEDEIFHGTLNELTYDLRFSPPKRKGGLEKLYITLKKSFDGPLQLNAYSKTEFWFLLVLKIVMIPFIILIGTILLWCFLELAHVPIREHSFASFWALVLALLFLSFVFCAYQYFRISLKQLKELANPVKLGVPTFEQKIRANSDNETFAKSFLMDVARRDRIQQLFDLYHIELMKISTTSIEASLTGKYARVEPERLFEIVHLLNEL